MSKGCHKKIVLVIEDEVNVQNFASRVLELEGYRVLQAENGDECFRLMRESQVDLIVLDLKLPGVDGRLVLEQLKNDPELSSVPVIVFTASAAASQREKALKMGATDYLVKPLSAASLRGAIARILKRRYVSMPSRKASVLVVDDNEEFCQSIANILKLKGYEVVTAYDGFKALELVKKGGFDLALIDVRMPAMDGVETFKRFKEVAPDTPVIMVTAYAAEDLIREALREGVYGFLEKPLDFDEFFRLVAQATGQGGTNTGGG